MLTSLSRHRFLTDASARLLFSETAIHSRIFSTETPHGESSLCSEIVSTRRNQMNVTNRDDYRRKSGVYKKTISQITLSRFTGISIARE